MKRALVVLLILGTSVLALTRFAAADVQPKVTICHATASETNPYVRETVDASSIVESFDGHGYSGVNVGDIIPPFSYDGGTYPGQGDQATLENGCRKLADPPVSTTVPPVTTTAPPVVTVPPVSTSVPPVPVTDPPALPTVPAKAPVGPSKALKAPAAVVAVPASVPLAALPFTGSNTWAIVGAGLVLLLAGGAVLHVARRH